ncbi:hypothetical protein [Flavilitoribacter nigricans]|uniref:hypothetical protein n=1 Tax=Flavilitoribacter nigricans TaxID=70997 RepID=UPI00117A07F8|nr:hypothetical protein [Flavilitoribacter nigricans]
MFSSEVNRFTIVTGFLLLNLLRFTLSTGEELRYFKVATIGGDYPQNQVSSIAYKDTLTDDSLFLVQSQAGIPLHYFKLITTEVCFERECRLLNIRVYWNITGRYLGFELPAGEFLSKRDHEPFSSEEYERLNDLLANPNLPLGNISFEALIETPAPDSVDAVSGATTTDVAKMVVKGAAYTTYTLWNILHGPSRERVAGLTEKQLTPELIDLILHSPDISDRVWALNRIDPKNTLSPKLSTSIMAFIVGDDFYLAYTAVRAITAAHLRAEALQLALFGAYPVASHSIQSMIISKLTEAPYLSPVLISRSRSLLGTLNGKQLGDILKWYAHHGVNDLETGQAVAEILKNENRFISRQAYTFLKKMNSFDAGITAALAAYEQK